MYKLDPTSCILPVEDRPVELRHQHFVITPNFQDQVLACKGIYALSTTASTCGDSCFFSLDVHDLLIDSVVDARNSQKLKYSIKENENASCDMCSQYLQVEIPKLLCAENEFRIEITWKTDARCSAIQWLLPLQTFSKSHPYVYTQLQAIHARSLFPCLDSPSFKCSYSAVIDLTECPGMKAVMSAQRKASPSDRSYLFAFAIGNIDGICIGPRSTVYGEPVQVQIAAKEFSDTETFLQLAEKVAGSPYMWTDYNILVLPPGFPFGGMENPCLTFVTPSLLAGDKSLVDVVIHEICHSWTGNSVTSCSWEHFWLNEGWTMFLERKILSQIYDEKYRHFSALLGLEELAADVEEYRRKCDPSPWTRLVVDLSNGKDPDDAFSRVPYEKGHTLLFYLETIVGQDAFLSYMQKYLKHFATRSISTDEWLQHLISSFPCGTFDTVDWEAWLHGHGMPPKIPNYDTSMRDSVLVLIGKLMLLLSL
ncbi:hypothetical protein DI09_76p80 [Mitosporidium daphniae]|uniref:Uncharacterized protein n=1 Tax=Mitosporidium daphniae TaxID=1485682 RepID=A0A098VNI2_9MICR|nr:uncharacterized protein DI09_76p80 [Mitosporidium daphniae]KGG50334.1 hypothetical protein DI09_76p80 [Mitosporidium daphniae]|eukprot:XP_013236775.1 uncharacterized protein DI09_76p80 [Mitosporidium daphniae]